MQIFVINLPASLERRKSIERQLNAAGLEYQFEEAVYGKNLSPEQVRELADTEHMARHAKYFTLGALGLTLTNKRILEKIISQNLPYALVLEDDVVIEADIKKVISDVEKHISDGEIILLYYKKYHSESSAVFSNYNKVKINSEFELVFPINEYQLDMACAVIYTNGAARGILRHSSPVKVVSDEWKYFYRQKAITQIRCIYPSPIRPADFKSVIEYAEVTHGPFMNKILQAIEDYHIFPFYQFLKRRRRKYRLRQEMFQFVDKASIFMTV